MHKRNRLSRSRDFDTVYRQGRSTASRFLVLYWFPQEEPAPPRFGFSVPRSVGDAVTRNRIKRLVREWLRLHGWIPKGMDVVIVAKDAAASLRGMTAVSPELARLHERIVAMRGAA